MGTGSTNKLDSLSHKGRKEGREGGRKGGKRRKEDTPAFIFFQQEGNVLEGRGRGVRWVRWEGYNQDTLFVCTKLSMNDGKYFIKKVTFIAGRGSTHLNTTLKHTHQLLPNLSWRHFCLLQNNFCLVGFILCSSTNLTAVGDYIWGNVTTYCLELAS